MEEVIQNGQLVKDLTLTNRVLNSQKGQYSKKRIQEEVALLVYYYPIRYLGFTEDENSDFFSTIFDKLPTMIAEFTYKGIPFEWFISRVIKTRAKSFKKNIAKREIRRATVRASLIETPLDTNEVQEPPSDYTPLPAYIKGLQIKKGICQTIVARRQILCLTLIAASELPEAQLDQLLTMCGCSKTVFNQWVAEIQELKKGKREQLNVYVQRRNKIYILLMETKSFLACCIKDEQKEILRKKILEYEKRLKKLQKTIGRFSLAPSHKEISKVTGIPRGTVSTTLARSKQLIRNIEHSISEK